MPALQFATHAPVRALTTLLLGWFGVLSFDLPWFANPLYFTALVLAVTHRVTAAQVCSLLAFVVGLLSLRVREWYFNEGSGTPVDKLGPAFYFWMASFAVLALLLFYSRSTVSLPKDDAKSQTA